jgi:hypothetical protein
MANRVMEALLLLLAIAVGARAIVFLFGPLIAPLLILTMLISLLFWVIRGPHASR